MDNIVDYIVIIFFIVSALGSLLKKKSDKKERQKPADMQKDKALRKREAAMKREEVRRRPIDPFEEVMDIFTGGQKKSKSEVDDYFEDAIQKSEKYLKPVEKVADKRIATRTKAMEFKPVEKMKKLDNKLYIINQRAVEIRNKLKNKSDVRELIIINEILNKPKAYRNKI